jgi:hypothetical protein
LSFEKTRATPRFLNANTFSNNIVSNISISFEHLISPSSEKRQRKRRRLRFKMDANFRIHPFCIALQHGFGISKFRHITKAAAAAEKMF